MGLFGICFQNERVYAVKSSSRARLSAVLQLLQRSVNRLTDESAAVFDVVQLLNVGFVKPRGDRRSCNRFCISWQP